MNPTDFPGGNICFGPPAGVDEAHCGTIRVRVDRVVGGSWDGAWYTAAAWLPSAAELELLKQGHPIYVVMLSQMLPPHYLSTVLPTEPANFPQ